MSRALPQEVFEILDQGLGLTLQDQGRVGWRRFGVPRSGAMDDHAMCWANRLLSNAPHAPVVEVLLQGAKLRALQAVWVSVTGADATVSIPMWRAARVEAGQTIEWGRNRSGVWSYLAIEGGFDEPLTLGSVSGYPRGGLGCAPARGETLQRAGSSNWSLPHGVAGRALNPNEIRDYNAPPALRVWPGPQWESFSAMDRTSFFEKSWTVSARSDRMGYRLEGIPFDSSSDQILSEPVLVGSIQVPPGGLPMVTMRDGPTVGGYPKLGILDPGDVSWLAQCRPGTAVRFQPIS